MLRRRTRPGRHHRDAAPGGSRGEARAGDLADQVKELRREVKDAQAEARTTDKARATAEQRAVRAEETLMVITRERDAAQTALAETRRPPRSDVAAELRAARAEFTEVRRQVDQFHTGLRAAEQAAQEARKEVVRLEVSPPAPRLAVCRPCRGPRRPAPDPARRRPRRAGPRRLVG